MAYTLLKNENIITGPRDWHQAYFEHFVSEELHQQVTIEHPPSEPLIFNESLKLVPTQIVNPTELNTIFDQIAGPRFYYDESNNHIAEFYAQEFPIESIKVNLKSLLANLRWVKETTPITRDINGKMLTLYTDRETRVMYSQALLLTNDDYSAEWKFPEGFFVINKTDLQLIVNSIMAHIQNCFNWESTKTAEIDAIQTTVELREYDLEKK
jgi:hypothetical protein